VFKELNWALNYSIVGWSLAGYWRKSKGVRGVEILTGNELSFENGC
jgi:hypothetical protein